MRLTRQTNYAIRILMFCAANSGQLSRIGDIASANGLSEAFLFKILKPLMRAELVQTVRGRNGGIRLARDPAKISLKDVVVITEENFELAECFSDEGSDCPLIQSCGLNSALREALNAFLAVLEKHTIKDIVDAKPDIHVLLGLDNLDPATTIRPLSVT